MSADHVSNWEICKQVGLWATPSNAGGAEAGDDLFLWKPTPDSGWLVHCRLTTASRRVRERERLPWPDNRRYKYVMGIEVISEPSSHIPMRGAEAAATAGLVHHVKLSQFGRMTAAGVEQLSTRFARPSRVEVALAELLAAAGIQSPPDVDQRDYARRLIAVRRGQQAFRQGLLHAFDHTCCISGSQVEATLEAAHIRPFRETGSHAPGNGLLLRTDLHTLFDLWLVTVLPSGTVRVAPELRGSEYEDFDERPIRPPVDSAHVPQGAALTEHNARCAWLD